MHNCVYIVSDGKASSVLYWLGVEAAKSSKQMPTPPAGEEPAGTGTMMEAWTDKLVAPKTDTVEGGLYSKFDADHPYHTPFLERAHAAPDTASTKLTWPTTESTVSTGMMGGKISVAWLIETDARKKKDVNVVVGHAQLLKAVGSVLNPQPSVVQVLRGDGKAMGEKGFKCMYYMQFE